MTRFRCLGPDCEASCCRTGWSIAIDAEQYSQLESAMAGSAADRARFGASVRRVAGPEATEHLHALMVLDERGACRLLDPEGTCSVHRRFGESVLPNTCAIYPRQVSLAHGHVELAGSLSCPEVARQLLARADSTVLDALDRSLLRNRATQHVDDPDDPYEDYLDDVRATVVGLLEAPYPLASRLFFVGWFAELTRAGFHRGAGPGAGAALEHAIAAASDEEALAAWHRGFESVEATAPLASQVIARALKDRLEEPFAYAPFKELVRACYAGLGAHADDDAVTVDAAAAHAAYLEKRAGRDGEAIDAMLTRYAVDYWLKDYYTASPDLGVHAAKLVLRIALLRFLLFTHPDFDAADPGRTLVEVTYKLARAVEHDHEFAENLDTLLARLEITSLAHAIFLMKV
jgi:lysine-N-methylase